MAKRKFVTVVAGDVCVDRSKSPYGRVHLYVKGDSKGGRWWHFFKSIAEWEEFWNIWHTTEGRSVLQLDDQTNPRKNYWRRVQ